MRFRFFLVAVLPCLLPSSAPAASPKHVVLVSVDGLAASYLRDSRAELPTLRKLADQGAVAEGMITTFPSVTWPAHTSLITGTKAATHGVIGNVVFDRKAGQNLVYIGDPTLTKDEAIRVPTLYDVVHAKGLTAGSVIWPCCNGAKSLNWVIPDSNKADLHARYTTAGFADELAVAGIDIKPLGEWGWDKKRSIDRDKLYTKVAQYLLDKHRPNLLLVHLITVDGVQHAYGPHSPEAYQAVAEADGYLREIWETLQGPGLAGKSALLVVSDHGFAPYDVNIQPNALLRQMGLVELDDQDKVVRRRAWCVSQGGSAFVYLLDKDKGDELLPKLKDSLGKLQGVESVIEPEGFGKLGLPDPDRNREMADLVLTTGPGYSFSDTVTGESIVSAGGRKGTHGHLTTPDYMHATFVAAGTGVKPGARLKTVSNLDVAPTIARLLGVELPKAEGRAMGEVLAVGQD